MLCIALCGCDNKNDNMTGYCVKNDHTVTTTEQMDNLLKEQQHIQNCANVTVQTNKTTTVL